LVDVVVAAVTAVHFAGGLSPHQCRIIVIMSGNAIICWYTVVLER
jgi:hypothetical protein